MNNRVFPLRLRQHLPELEALVRQHATGPVSIILTDSVERWSRENHKHDKGDPLARAIIGERKIIMRKMIKKYDFLGSVSRFDIVGRGDMGRLLRNDPHLFLHHLALHELAHIENKWGQDRENDCDGWAEERLPG